METTNSESSGRNTRYSPPADDATVNPSSRPISSSWSKWPRLEKKRFPGSRQMLCRRPLLSVSRTHSPALSGPRWTPDQTSGATSSPFPASVEPMTGTLLTGLPERPVDVGSGQDAVDGAVLVEEEVLGGRVATDRQ